MCRDHHRGSNSVQFFQQMHQPHGDTVVNIAGRFIRQQDMGTGDDGARDLLKGETVTSVPLPGDHATLDLDTPEAWARWRKA